MSKAVSRREAYQSDAMLKAIRENSSSDWAKIRQETMLDLFHEAAQRVPAYKDFLAKHGIKHEKIGSLSDFAQVPATNKANYLREYPLASLLWDGSMDTHMVFAATSGSTGKPFYFPRNEQLTGEYATLIDLFLENGPSQGPVLVIICLGMGVWIGGIFTFQAFQLASSRGKNLSLLTPGLNKGEILHALRELSPQYAQTILVGYPPFVKDILDEAQSDGIDLGNSQIRLLFAAESFTETFRDHIANLAHMRDPIMDTLNIYGTADIGAMAWETPTSILVRRYALPNPDLRKALFTTTDKIPTLAQYNPHYTNFEAPKGEILLTGNSALPLIRYAVGDKGGVLDFDELTKIAHDSGVDLQKSAADANVPVYQLPFVFVYERSDFSVKLSGAIIYPEPVRAALQAEEFSRTITGKFTLRTMHDAKHDPYLELHVELRKGVHPSPELLEAIQGATVRSLLHDNSEFKAVYNATKERATPKVILWPHEDPTYFKPTTKQKWVIKD